MKTRIIIILIILMMVLSGCKSNESTALVSSDSASLGEVLIFPPGYHLVSMAIYNTDATVKVIYVCQSDDDPTIYHICIPKTG